MPEVPPPGPLFLTKKLRSPGAASAAIVRIAFRVVELSTIVDFTMIPSPTSTELTPLIKFVPVKTTSRFCDLPPNFGSMLVKVGAGLLTAKICASEVPPPGAGLNTVILNVPAVVKSLAGMMAVNCLLLTKDVVRSEPLNRTTDPDTKFVPLTIIANSASFTVLLVGEMLLKVGAGLFAKLTVNV